MAVWVPANMGSMGRRAGSLELNRALENEICRSKQRHVRVLALGGLLKADFQRVAAFDEDADEFVAPAAPEAEELEAPIVP